MNEVEERAKKQQQRGDNTGEKKNSADKYLSIGCGGEGELITSWQGIIEFLGKQWIILMPQTRQ